LDERGHAVVSVSHMSVENHIARKTRTR
jgi:hypothetical protein